jgi:hypothetical protein
MTSTIALEAANLVNDDILDCPEVTDEQKYRDLLEKRKNRRPVSLIDKCAG